MQRGYEVRLEWSKGAGGVAQGQGEAGKGGSAQGGKVQCCIRGVKG